MKPDQLKEEIEKLVKSYVKYSMFKDYEEWVIEIESMRNELVSLFNSHLEAREKEIASEYEDLRDKQGRNLRFYLLPHTEHKKGDDGNE